MKKFFLMLAIASMSLSAMAQADPTEKYSVATNSFWSNWFIQTNVTWNSYWSGGNNHLFSSPFRKFGLGSEPWTAAEAGKGTQTPSQGSEKASDGASRARAAQTRGTDRAAGFTCRNPKPQQLGRTRR